MPEGPVRTCVGCRRRDQQDRLLRVVAEGEAVVVDPGRRAPGRGAYVHPDPACVASAVKRRAFGRALRAAVEGAAAAEALRAYLEKQAAGPAPEARPGLALGRLDGSG